MGNERGNRQISLVQRQAEEFRVELTNAVEGVVDKRKLSRNAELKAALIGDEYAQLAATQYMARAAFETLPKWMREAVEAVATGRGMYKGTMVGRSAARVHGMWMLPWAPFAHEVTLPSGKRPAGSKALRGAVYRWSPLRDDEKEKLHGVEVTDAVRTCIDIARYYGFVEGLVAMDWVLAAGKATREQLREAAAKMGRFRNKAVVLRSIDCAVSGSDSALESWFRAELIERGVGGWKFQAQIGPFRADFLFDEILVVEIDGRSKTRDKANEVLRAERDRERWMLRQGHPVMRYYYEDLRDHLDRVLAEIEDARRRRHAAGGASAASGAGRKVE